MKVGPYRYSVIQAAPPPERLGQTEADALTITVSPALPADRKAETVLHECLHAVWDLSGIRSGVKEEHVVSRLATPLLALLRENPRLVAYLVAK